MTDTSITPTSSPFISIKRDRFIMWGVLLVAGWLAYTLLLFLPNLWITGSSLPEQVPGLYKTILGLFPAWLSTRGAGEWVASLNYALLICGLWAVYLAAVRSLKGDVESDEREDAQHPRLQHILAGSLIFGVLALSWMGLFSTDVYAYAIQGKMQVVYGLNPLLHTPSEVSGDRLYGLSPWTDVVAYYGPVWLGVSWGVSALAEALGGSPVIYVLAYRLFNLGLLLLSVWLVWDIGGLLRWRRARRAQATALFAWCPIVIIEFVGNAHLDAIVVAFTLVAIWLHLRGAWPWALVALTLGGLVKVTGFFLVPAYLVLLFCSSLRKAQAVWRVAAGMAITLSLIGIAYIPYADRLLGAVLVKNPVAGFVINSLASTVRETLIDLALLLRGTFTPTDLTWRQALEVVRWPVWYGSFIVWGVPALFLSLRVRDFAGLLRTWGFLAFSYLLIASVWFWPWYATWVMPIVVLLPASSRIRRAGLLLAFGSLIAYSVLPHTPSYTQSQLYPYYVPAVIFGPAVVYCLWIGGKAIIKTVRTSGVGSFLRSEVIGAHIDG